MTSILFLQPIYKGEFSTLFRNTFKSVSFAEIKEIFCCTCFLRLAAFFSLGAFGTEVLGGGMPPPPPPPVPEVAGPAPKLAAEANASFAPPSKTGLSKQGHGKDPGYSFSQVIHT